MAKRAADSDLAPTPKKARPDGKGTHTDADGTVADGVFADGQLVKGTKTHKNGLVETGAFVGDQLVKGTHTDADGTVQTGVFADGQIVKGTKTYKDGTVQTGVFADDVLVKGTGTYKDGTVEEGTFISDLVRGTRTPVRNARTHLNTKGEEDKHNATFFVLRKGVVTEEGEFSKLDEDDDSIYPVLRKGTQCETGIHDFENHKIPKPLYKGIWGSDGKFVKGVKFYYTLKAQAFEDGERTGDAVSDGVAHYHCESVDCMFGDCFS